MRVFGFRVPFFVAVLLLGLGSTVWALGHHRAQVETVYLGPATTTLAVPSSYVVTSSWVEPTSYVVPTGYATAYVTDPVAVLQPTYLTRTFVRTGLFGRRRLVERPVGATYGLAYPPTSYYVPSAYYSALPTVMTDPVVWPSSYLASADCVCPERVALAASPSRSPSGATTAPRSGAGSKTLRSEPADESAMPSDVEPASAEKAPTTGPAALTNPRIGETLPTNAKGNAPDAASPPSVPALPPDPVRPTDTPAPLKPSPTSTTVPATSQQGGAIKQTIPAPPGVPNPPLQANPNSNDSATPSTAPRAPGGDLNPLPPDPNPPGELRYQAQRPAFPTRPRRAEIRNVLLGKVHSRGDDQPEEGVRIRVTNAYDQGRDKSTLTDAFGRFAMHLTDGEWTVHVTMPSGRIYPVSEIRVNDGQIVDSLGRRVPSLEITR